jgi:hypothetical protein
MSRYLTQRFSIFWRTGKIPICFILLRPTVCICLAATIPFMSQSHLINPLMPQNSKLSQGCAQAYNILYSLPRSICMRLCQMLYDVSHLASTLKITYVSPSYTCSILLHQTQTISQETQHDTSCLTLPNADPASNSKPKQPWASASASLGANPTPKEPSDHPQLRTGITETTRSILATTASSSANLPRQPTPACTLSASLKMPLTPVCLLAWTACVGTKRLLLYM